MWLFTRRKRNEIWDEPVDGPIGDIDAAQRIREICRAARDSAEKVAANGALSDKTATYERERYQRGAKAAMEVAIKMSDDLMRDASVGDIVRLCMKANDLKTARVLLRAIQEDSIKYAVLNDHPSLGE